MDYEFNLWKQYLDYIIEHLSKLDTKQIKKFNAVTNKIFTATGKLKNRYSNEDACKILKEYCDSIGLKDYYLY